MHRVTLHYGERSLFWSLIIYWIWVSQRFGDKIIGFNRCECIKFLNAANIHALDVWWKRMFICNNKIFLLCFFSIESFCNATFFHSGYVIKHPQPSSAIYGAPYFTVHRKNTLISCLLQVWHILRHSLAFFVFVDLATLALELCEDEHDWFHGFMTLLGVIQTRHVSFYIYISRS